MPSLADLLSTSASEIARHLDALAPQARLHQVLALSARQQATLFELAEGHRDFTLDDLAPATTTPLLGVPHEGRNSLYAFTRFAKVFAVPDEPSLVRSERWGFNETSALVTTTVGPGYFVAVQQGPEVLVDYTRLPPKPLTAAPRPLPNSARLSRFVYNQTKDVVRGDEARRSVGRAGPSFTSLPQLTSGSRRPCRPSSRHLPER